jgi:hypothetical protein
MTATNKEKIVEEARKSYIIARALYVAAEHLGALPFELKPASDIADMEALLATDYFKELRMMRDS